MTTCCPVRHVMPVASAATIPGIAHVSCQPPTSPRVWRPVGAAHVGCRRHPGAWRAAAAALRRAAAIQLRQLARACQRFGDQAVRCAPGTTANRRQGRFRRRAGDQVPRRPGAMADRPRCLPGTTVPRRSLQSVRRAHQRAVKRPGARTPLFARLLRLQKCGARRHVAARPWVFRLSRHGRARQGNRLAGLPGSELFPHLRRGQPVRRLGARHRHQHRHAGAGGVSALRGVLAGRAERRCGSRSPSTRCSTGQASPAPTASRR